MLDDSEDLQFHITRLRCLDGYTKIGEAEVTRVLRMHCATLWDALTAIKEWLDFDHNKYPAPGQLRTLLLNINPINSNTEAVERASCAFCVEGWQVVHENGYTAARRCPYCRGAEPRPPAPTTQEAETEAEIAALIAEAKAAAAKAKALPEAKGASLPPDTNELYLPEGKEALLNQARVNSERLDRAAAAAAKAAQVAELERKYGKIQ